MNISEEDLKEIVERAVRDALRLARDVPTKRVRPKPRVMLQETGFGGCGRGGGCGR